VFLVTIYLAVMSEPDARGAADYWRYTPHLALLGVYPPVMALAGAPWPAWCPGAARSPGGAWCARHGPWIGGASPLWSELVATTSRRQLHGREAVWGRSLRRAAAPNASEALSRPGRPGERALERDAQNPTEVGAVLGTGAAVHPVSLPWEVCMGPSRGFDRVRVREALPSGRPEGGNDNRPKPRQKSDLFVVAWKPVKAGGAKGEMD
jgi:hypothetical protein